MTERRVITKFQGQYRWLSNFWPARVPMTTRKSNGEAVTHVFNTSEAAYQASKFPESEWGRFASLSGDHAGARTAKRMGRGRKHTDPTEAVACMRLVIAAKFSPVNNPHLTQMLLDTDRLEIEEGNDWGDNFWGVSPPQSGNGENWLGKILMDRRSFLVNSGFGRKP